MCCFTKTVKAGVGVFSSLHVLFLGRLSLVGLEYQRFCSVYVFFLGWGGLEMKRNKMDKRES